MCELNGIRYVEQEESYTSQSSFWDKDDIPVYKVNSNQEYTFSGKRTYRGMYKRNNGKKLNADVNGALNILRKSNVVSLDALYSRGEVDTPVRILVVLIVVNGTYIMPYNIYYTIRRLNSLSHLIY